MRRRFFGLSSNIAFRVIKINQYDQCDRFTVTIGVDAIAQSRREGACDQAIIAIKQGNVIDLPENIPDFILAHLNKLNCDRSETEPDNPTVQLVQI
ncbi:hypothetical protein [uncultured Nostoc sp.]|uniref:hypothetical protein n=1 Tax=uncultured Nostoc sp. TaxID=340711 RepID=UPI0035CB117D